MHGATTDFSSEKEAEPRPSNLRASRSPPAQTLPDAVIAGGNPRLKLRSQVQGDNDPETSLATFCSSLGTYSGSILLGAVTT
jgi:hypothetical protein